MSYLFVICTFQSLVFWFFFHPNFFYRSFDLFQFYPSIKIDHIFCFLFGPYSFNFLFDFNSFNLFNPFQTVSIFCSYLIPLKTLIFHWKKQKQRVDRDILVFVHVFPIIKEDLEGCFGNSYLNTFLKKLSACLPDTPLVFFCQCYASDAWFVMH